jgi:hypothetical protein
MCIWSDFELIRYRERNDREKYLESKLRTYKLKLETCNQWLEKLPRPKAMMLEQELRRGECWR